MNASVFAPPPDWTASALCAQADPETWFPEKCGVRESRLAKRICARCPVQQECLDYALSNRELYGIYGGLSARERRGMEAPA